MEGSEIGTNGVLQVDSTGDVDEDERSRGRQSNQFDGLLFSVSSNDVGRISGAELLEMQRQGGRGAQGFVFRSGQPSK